MGQTIQSGIKTYIGTDKNDFNKYTLFTGGLNTTYDALKQYSPLRTGYGRIFFIRMPYFMEKEYPKRTKTVKHLLEYGSTAIEGIGNLTLEFESLSGGYAGKSFDTPTVSKDDTNEITIRLYEFVGSPIGEYMNTWISGIADPNTGFATGHNAKVDGKRIDMTDQSNYVAEAVFVHTGPTGRADDIQYVCMLTNMMPKQATEDHFNYTAGEHTIPQISQTFTCCKYRSKDINELGKALIKKYIVLRDFLDFKSGWSIEGTGDKTIQGLDKDFTGEDMGGTSLYDSDYDDGESLTWSKLNK